MIKLFEVGKMKACASEESIFVSNGNVCVTIPNDESYTDIMRIKKAVEVFEQRKWLGDE